jgi:hypothetical protein
MDMKTSAEILNASKPLKARIEPHHRILGLQIPTPEWTMIDPLRVFKSGSFRRNSNAQVEDE